VYKKTVCKKKYIYIYNIFKNVCVIIIIIFFSVIRSDSLYCEFGVNNTLKFDVKSVFGSSKQLHYRSLKRGQRKIRIQLVIILSNLPSSEFCQCILSSAAIVFYPVEPSICCCTKLHYIVLNNKLA